MVDATAGGSDTSTMSGGLIRNMPTHNLFSATNFNSSQTPTASPRGTKGFPISLGRGYFRSRAPLAYACALCISRSSCGQDLNVLQPQKKKWGQQSQHALQPHHRSWRWGGIGRSQSPKLTLPSVNTATRDFGQLEMIARPHARSSTGSRRRHCLCKVA